MTKAKKTLERETLEELLKVFSWWLVGVLRVAIHDRPNDIELELEMPRKQLSHSCERLAELISELGELP